MFIPKIPQAIGLINNPTQRYMSKKTYLLQISDYSCLHFTNYPKWKCTTSIYNFTNQENYTKQYTQTLPLLGLWVPFLHPLFFQGFLWNYTSFIFPACLFPCNEMHDLFFLLMTKFQMIFPMPFIPMPIYSTMGTK